MSAIRDCLGRERTPDRVWDDGSYSCPFCWSAAKSDGCKNPMCFARVDPTFPVERAQALLAAEEERKAETARRERDNEWRRQYQAEQDAEHARKRQALREKCALESYCYHCAFKGFPYIAPKLVRHRKGCTQIGPK